jgi:dUTP pyrophosphatase
MSNHDANVSINAIISKMEELVDYLYTQSGCVCDEVPTIIFEKVSEDVSDPKFATEGSVAFDLSVNSSGIIRPGETVLVGTGLKFRLPEGYFMSVRPRSGVSVKTDVWLKNSPGTIDTDYTGEVKLILHNSGEGEFMYSRGDRLAQGLIERAVRIDLWEGSVVDTESRGSNGFGSSGIK